MGEWFENDAQWRDTTVAAFGPAKMAAGEDEVTQIVELTGRSGGAVLDLCCGPGRHAVPLAKRGFEVTGVDRTAPFLDRARERARAAGVTVAFAQDDMRRFVRPDAFDLALCLFVSFDHLCVEARPRDER